MTVGGRTFRVPAGARVKVREPIAWVLSGNLVHVYSARGEAVLRQGQARHYAELWGKI